MKLKSDFVTNSSSSSFIVSFDEKPNKKEDLNILFIEKAECVFNDIQNKKGIKITKQNVDKQSKRLASIMSEGDVNGKSYSTFYDQIERERNITIYKLPTEERNKINKEIRKITFDYFNDKAKKFLNDIIGQTIYLFVYSDNDGEFYSEMEHGWTFRKYPHIQISNH